MKSDIEIAMEAVLEPIKDVIKKVDIEEDDIDLYGKYKAKISDEMCIRDSCRPYSGRIYKKRRKTDRQLYFDLSCN